MSSVAFNLTKKIEWMGRRLRWIDDPAEIKEWVAVMTAINKLLKEVETKCCSDSWHPWSKREGGKKELGTGIRTVKPLRANAPETKERMEPNKKSWFDGRLPKLSLKERLLKEVKKKVAGKVSINTKGLPPRVAVDEEVLELKAFQVSNLKKIQEEYMNDNDSGVMEVDIVDNDDAARKVKESSIQKWKWLQEAGTPRRIELNWKWKQRLDEKIFFEKKGVNQYRCNLERCKEEETCRNEEELFLHSYTVHGFWNNVEF